MDNKPSANEDKFWDLFMKFVLPFGNNLLGYIIQALYGSIIGCIIGYVFFDYHGEVKGNLDLAFFFIILPAFLFIVFTHIMINKYNDRYGHKR